MRFILAALTLCFALQGTADRVDLKNFKRLLGQKLTPFENDADSIRLVKRIYQDSLYSTLAKISENSDLQDVREKLSSAKSEVLQRLGTLLGDIDSEFYLALDLFAEEFIQHTINRYEALSVKRENQKELLTAMLEQPDEDSNTGNSEYAETIGKLASIKAIFCPANDTGHGFLMQMLYLAKANAKENSGQQAIPSLSMVCAEFESLLTFSDDRVLRYMKEGYGLQENGGYLAFLTDEDIASFTRKAARMMKNDQVAPPISDALTKERDRMRENLGINEIAQLVSTTNTKNYDILATNEELVGPLLEELIGYYEKSGSSSQRNEEKKHS